MPITGLNVLNTFHHTSKADRWIEVKWDQVADTRGAVVSKGGGDDAGIQASYVVVQHISHDSLAEDLVQ